jgi:hypothetical protein
LGQLEGVMDAAFKGAPAVDLIAQPGSRLAYFLRRLRVVPEFRRGDLFVKFGELLFLVDEVKDAPVIVWSVPWPCSSVRSGLAWCLHKWIR